MKYLLLLLMIWAPVALSQQIIVEAEYFADFSTPAGEGTPFYIPDLSEEMIISWEDLPPQTYNSSGIYIRVKSSGFYDVNEEFIFGQWSCPIFIKMPKVPIISQSTMAIRRNWKLTEVDSAPTDGAFDEPIEIIASDDIYPDIFHDQDEIVAKLSTRDNCWQNFKPIAKIHLANKLVASSEIHGEYSNSPLAVRLSWQDNTSKEKFYSLERQEQNGPWEIIARVEANVNSYADESIQAEIQYNYRLRAIGSTKQLEIIDSVLQLEVLISTYSESFQTDFDFNLLPNPAHGAFYIKYSLPHKDMVSIKLYDLQGREIKSLVNQEQLGGKYSIYVRGNMPIGAYICTFKTKDYKKITKLIISH